MRLTMAMPKHFRPKALVVALGLFVSKIWRTYYLWILQQLPQTLAS